MHDQLSAPAGSKLLAEAAAVIQVPRLASAIGRGRRLTPGSATVITIPGFGTTDRFLAPLRIALGRAGHRCSGWNLGRNDGQVEETLPHVVDRVRSIADASGDPVALIGWSLGGVFAREVARDEPSLVDRVITFGTPVVGGPKYTRSASFYEAEKVEAIASSVARRNLIPIERPITAIHSRADGAVDWRACIDDFSPDVDNVEVRSTHVGMTIDPDVWTIVADRLA